MSVSKSEIKTVEFVLSSISTVLAEMEYVRMYERQIQMYSFKGTARKSKVLTFVLKTGIARYADEW